MHTRIIELGYTNTKLKAWFRHLLCHPPRKRSGSILHRYTPRTTRGTRHLCELVGGTKHLLGTVGFNTTTEGVWWRRRVNARVNIKSNNHSHNQLNSTTHLC